MFEERLAGRKPKAGIGEVWPIPAFAERGERVAEIVVRSALARAFWSQRVLSLAPVTFEFITVTPEVLGADDLGVALDTSLLEIDELAAGLIGRAGRREETFGFVTGLLVVSDRGEMGHPRVGANDQHQPRGGEGGEQTKQK